MNQIVIIADDLTGAADTGVQFCHFYDDTFLISYLHLSNAVLPASRSAVALYTNSRALEMLNAHKRLGSVARRLAELKPLWVYKKMDSCLRGNPGAETEALMDELAYEASFIAPAFPEMGRTTVNGTHLIHGIPVGQTEISRDPVTPVTESDLRTVIKSQCRYPVGHIPLNLLEEGDTALGDEIERQIRGGIRHIVFDTTCREHLDRIARLIFSSSHRILPAGSAGLAAGFGGLLPSEPRLKTYDHRSFEGGNHLLVCGTNSEVTRRQIKTLVAAYPYEEIALDRGILADADPRDAFLNSVSLVRSKLSAKHVVITMESPQQAPVSARLAQPTTDGTIDDRRAGAFAGGSIDGDQTGTSFSHRRRYRRCGYNFCRRKRDPNTWRSRNRRGTGHAYRWTPGWSAGCDQGRRIWWRGHAGRPA